MLFFKQINQYDYGLNLNELHIFAIQQAVGNWKAPHKKKTISKEQRERQ